MAMFFLTSVCAFGAGSDKSEVKGMIIGRNGESLLVDSGGGKVTVLLTDDTTTKDNTGLFGLDREHLSSVVLIPGLKVDVNGVSNEQGQIVAKTITVDGDDLEAAEMMQAGLHPTAKQVEANVKAISTNQKNISANQQEIATNQEHLASHDEDIEMNMKDIAAHEQKITKNMRAIEENTNRFTALTDYDVKGEATVKFNAGSSKISTEDQEEIKKVAQIATGLKGYIIEVMGYADATGSAAMNTKLSEDRAKAVVTALIQQGNVPVRHIVAPGAMGEYGSVAPNETQAGRAENRRVEVKVLVNKGIAGN